ncbi:MAG: dihydropteroate synthase [Fuerstiella sp.]
MSNSDFQWHVGDCHLSANNGPLLMGILNVTPDSFSDGGQHDGVAAAVQHAMQLVEDGANIIDVGGESTRPGAAKVSEAEELRRIVPVITEIAVKSDVVISIDTTKSEVARQAIEAGATIVNDISGLTFDPEMVSLCAEKRVAVCAMHIQGTPQTMQHEPTYQDVVSEVTDILQQHLDTCVSAGIELERLCIDPGIGFGKSAQQNVLLMQAIPSMKNILKRPLLIGHSRKRFLSKLLGRDVEERLAGTIGVSIALAENQADVLRIHDVAAVRDAIIAWQAVRMTADNRASQSKNGHVQ